MLKNNDSIFCFGGLVLNEMDFEQLGLGSRDNHEWTGMVPNDRSSEIEIKYKKVPFLLQFRSLRSRNKDKNRKCKIKNNEMPIYGHHVTKSHGQKCDKTDGYDTTHCIAFLYSNIQAF